MTLLSEMFDSATGFDVTAPFPLPHPAPASGSTEPEEACRFAGEPLQWLHLPAGTAIKAFAHGSRRVYQRLEPGVPGDATAAGVLIELSPLPAFIAFVLHRLAGGLPVEYVLLHPADLPVTPDEEIGVGVGETLITPTADTWVGLARQDRVCLDPRAWSHELNAAATGAPSVFSPGWSAWVARLAEAPARVRVLDHVGRPLSSGTFDVDSGPGVPSSVTLTAANPGDSGVDVTGAGASVTAQGAIGVLASGTTDAGALGGQLAVTADDRHVLATDLDHWLAPRSTGVTLLERFVTNSHVEPLVDGTPYFERLVGDLRAAKGAHGAAQLAGWAFNQHAHQDPSRPWDLIPGHDDTEIVALIDELVASGMDVRLLVNQFLQLTDADVQQLHADALVFLITLITGMGVAEGFNLVRGDDAGWVGLLAAYALLLIPSEAPLRAILTAVAEISKDTVEAINNAHPGVAVWTPYPAAFADNPLGHDPLSIGGIELPLHHIGVYHMKIAMTKPAGGQPVAHVGGIDINSDRVDDPVHRAIAPYHDVQVRLTGPAANEVAKIYNERAIHHGATAPIAPADDSSSLAAAGTHIVQIGRTYYRPAAGPPPFPSAPQGERTTHDTLLRAIASARDFIYIEDQYFTPEIEYVDELTAAGGAAGGARALVITVPDRTDQPFGAERRGEIVARLRTTWGDRLRIGAPMRRFMDPTPSGTAGLGRFVLRANVAPGEDEMVFGPAVRIPKPPFWAFVEGELVYVQSVAAASASPGSDAAATQRFDVVRDDGPTPKWGAEVSAHDEGAPVLAVQIPGIYVHAKLMIVDDVFVSVGSSNLNRRGFFHDGEVNAFAIPAHLKRDPDNPALRLRCRLWAEHLGLSPELGLSLLADPLSALRYFDRSWYSGSRWQPLTFSGSTPPPLVSVAGGTSLGSLLLTAAVGTVEDHEKPDVWATLVDPTSGSDSHVDPAHDKGPGL
jgi:phosphatidylserine/phosphatidylglycerophosphate/cardiolipin synthase-like enzyme